MSKGIKITCFKVLVLIALALWTSGEVHAQLDSVFSPEVLGAEDIIPKEPKEEIEITSASRIPTGSDEVSQRTFIIKQDEIRRNGWSSLVDVLRNLPGFRSSQPGSASLGETFLMRGLLGNLYTKILINGVPVRPSGAPGMPLGAQLPIRQAERIEIILGPSAALYGNDALGGVINIVMPEIERPVEATASASVGNFGQEELHLFLGGRAGKGDNTVRYNFFGSSRRMQDLGLLLTDSITNIDTTGLSTNPFLHLEDSTTTVRVEDFPHQSNLVGGSVSFRGLEFSTMLLFRKDHASVGADPTELAYDSPFSFYADIINSNRIIYKHHFRELGRKKRMNIWMNTNLSYLVYELDKNSSYFGIDHPISNSENFMYASSRDLFGEQLVNFSWGSIDTAGRIDFMVGGAVQYNKGTAFLNFLNRPFEEEQVIPDPNNPNWLIIQSDADEFSNVTDFSRFNNFEQLIPSAIARFGYSRRNVNFAFSGRMDKSDSTEFVFLPQLNFYARPLKWLSLQGQAGRAYREAGAFYTYSNFREQPRIRPLPPPQMGMDTTYQFDFVYKNLKPEILDGFELGMNFHFGKAGRLELNGFYHRMQNSILLQTSEGNDQLAGTHEAGTFIGYDNRESVSQLGAAQATLYLFSKYADVVFFVQRSWGKEGIFNVDTTSQYRGVPNWMAQANLFLKIPYVGNLSFFGKFNSNFLNTFVQVDDDLVIKETPGFVNLDLGYHREITRRMSVTGRVYNVLGEVTKGIYSSGIIGHTLPYNPQPGRTWMVGLNFDLIVEAKQ